MRNRRAYLASFGTGGSLVACAALVFILASAFVAFNGWPAVGATPSTGSVVIQPASSATAPAATRLAALTVAATPIRTVAARAGAGRLRGRAPARPHAGGSSAPAGGGRAAAS